jgi:hypothetical protein
VTCEKCREHILDSVGEQHIALVRDHLSSCLECRSFHESQQELHGYFVSGSAANLSPAFRHALRTRLADECAFVWPDFLPDIAHLAGGITATLVSVFVLPWPAVPVLVTGAAFTGFTYFLQAKLRDAFQDESS